MYIFHLLTKHLERNEIVSVCSTGRLNYVLQHFLQVHSSTGKQSCYIYHEYNSRSGCVCLKEPLKCETGTKLEGVCRTRKG